MDGAGTILDFSSTFTINPIDYQGAGNQVHLRWSFVADGATSDEDCGISTIGAAQIDLIEVYFDQGTGPVQQGYTEDCEGIQPVQWVPSMGFGVGDFAKVWSLLNDIDACRENSSPQVAFIDDGQVVPGTGGYLGTTYLYGPSGYIVNPEGGLLGPDFYILNRIESPLLAWPGDNYNGAVYRWDVFSHEELSDVSPGVFYRWFVRSTADPVGADGWTEWRSDNTVWYGPGVFLRHDEVVTDLLEPGRQWVQIALSCEEWGWIWGYLGTDGTPSPYFDNVSLVAFTFEGPGISANELLVAQDDFPAIGSYNYVDPAANSIRFDMARNISLPNHLRNDPGDSIVCDVAPVRAGSRLNDMPKLYYKMKPNPLFDSVRTFPTEGWVYGDTTYGANGAIVENRYNFDLPDEGFFFPGDVIHYYIEGQDNVGGNIGTTLMPADTNGYSDFDTPLSYQHPYGTNAHPNFTVRGLPTFTALSEGAHPEILFWNDMANRGAENEWSFAFQNLGYKEGVDFDYYYTNAPDASEGNGLGGRATSAQLAGYSTILYTCGNLFTGTICNGDFNVSGCDDVGVLDSWFRQGSSSAPRNMYLNGDDLAMDLTQSGIATLGFLNNWIGVTLESDNLRPQIDYQATPTVQAISGNGIFNQINQWVAYGGCLGINTFDAVVPIGTTQALAEFLDPGGSSNQYSYAAATLNYNATFNARVIYTPYAFHYIYTPGGSAKSRSPVAARTQMLEDILLYFGHSGASPTTDVPEVGAFTVRNYPNPFNPSTEIEYSMPQRGEISIKIFNVRGELVKVLLDQVIPAGRNSVTWDGTDANGNAVASGVYFYETQTSGHATVNKMALVK